MSLFHENIKQILSDFEKFLTDTLKKEKLSKKSNEAKQQLVEKLQQFFEENPSMQLVTQDVKQPQDESSLTGGNTKSDDNEEIKYIDSGVAVIAAADLKDPVCYGNLEKKQKKGSGMFGTSKFQSRWCVVQGGVFYYYVKNDDKKQRGAFRLEGYMFRNAPDLSSKKKEKDLCFEVYANDTTKRIFQFMATNTEDYEKWKEIITYGGILIEEDIYEPVGGSEELNVTGGSADDYYVDVGMKVTENTGEVIEVVYDVATNDEPKLPTPPAPIHRGKYTATVPPTPPTPVKPRHGLPPVPPTPMSPNVKSRKGNDSTNKDQDKKEQESNSLPEGIYNEGASKEFDVDLPPPHIEMLDPVPTVPARDKPPSAPLPATTRQPPPARNIRLLPSIPNEPVKTKVKIDSADDCDVDVGVKVAENTGEVIEVFYEVATNDEPKLSSPPAPVHRGKYTATVPLTPPTPVKPRHNLMPVPPTPGSPSVKSRKGNDSTNKDQDKKEQESNSLPEGIYNEGASTEFDVDLPPTPLEMLDPVPTVPARGKPPSAPLPSTTRQPSPARNLRPLPSLPNEPVKTKVKIDSADDYHVDVGVKVTENTVEVIEVLYEVATNDEPKLPTPPAPIHRGKYTEEDIYDTVGGSEELNITGGSADDYDVGVKVTENTGEVIEVFYEAAYNSDNKPTNDEPKPPTPPAPIHRGKYTATVPPTPPTPVKPRHDLPPVPPTPMSPSVKSRKRNDSTNKDQDKKEQESNSLPEGIYNEGASTEFDVELPPPPLEMLDPVPTVPARGKPPSAPLPPTTRQPQPAQNLRPLPSLPNEPVKTKVKIDLKHRPDEDFDNLYYGKWDCTSDLDNELSFKKGDIVHILSRQLDDKSWWVGRQNGNFGLVPKNYLTPAYILAR